MRDHLGELAAQTVAIVEAGGYLNAAGEWVDIAAGCREAIAGTRHYLPTDQLPDPDANPDLARAGSAVQRATSAQPTIEVTMESTVEAGYRLGPDTVALVFASARKPGGGFLTGAKSQEEDIARCSALHACLSTVPSFYAYHRAGDDLRYSDRVIYSPRVPVFRDEDARLLDHPFPLSLLTAAAPNLRAIARSQPECASSVPAVLATRAERVLRVAAAHGHRRLVLGAWGCGVFGNDPSVVAAAFRTALDRVPAFDQVTFAILDRTGHGATYRTFAAAFAG